MENNIEISKDKSKLEIEVIYEFLKTTYWANTRTRKEVEETIKNSDCFGLYLNNKQIGFLRVLTDKVAFAYLMDVFILDEYRGNGYSKLLLSEVMKDQEYQKVKMWMLKTSDAHKLYEKFGFGKLDDPEKYMLRSNW